MSFRNRPRRKRSPIWTVDKTELEKIVKESATIAEILKKLEIYTVGGNRTSLMRRLSQEKIDTSHIPSGLDSNKGRKSFSTYPTKIDNENLFVENSKTPRSVVRRRILKENLIPYVCAECNLDSTWKNKPLSLVLDHINGIPNDHRLENLRWLCPNCNSQTETFCGRNNKYIVLA